MKARFTGHDTFSLRYGWLYKAVAFINSDGKFLTSNEQALRRAIVDLGVGKNMVNAIRYWAETSGVIKPFSKNNFIVHKVTSHGKYLFGDTANHGKDPYLEQVGSVWLIHFWLNFNYEQLTAYRYFFNYSNVQYFEKNKFITDCLEDSKSIVVNDVGNEITIKKDVDCFLNNYSKKIKNTSSKKKSSVNEDSFTSPLTELNLIQDIGGGYFTSDLKERHELPIEIFIYALINFIKLETEDSQIHSLDFDALLTKPYSPGRIFRLSESGLGQKLDESQEYTNNDISWIDSLGLRQVKISPDTLNCPEKYLDKYYGV
jgi:hypothetical protein